MTTPLIRQYMELMIHMGGDPAQVYWFDICDADTMGNSSSDEILYWLINSLPPFERCVAVFRGHDGSGGIRDVVLTLFGMDQVEGIAVDVRIASGNGIFLNKTTAAYTVVDGNVELFHGDAPQSLTKLQIGLLMGCIATFYRALSSERKAYIPTAKDAAVNRKRIAKGKKPLYDWRTVIVSPKKSQAESLGGTHASPRLHDRRGHLRKYKSGKTGWVKACKVGNAALGTVFHDYEVRTPCTQSS